MNSDTIDLLKQLAARFGVGVDYLWPLLVNYTRMYNAAWLIINVLILVGAVTVFVLAAKLFLRHVYLYNNRDDKDYNDYSLHAAYYTSSAVTCVICVAVALTAINQIPGNFAGVVVPEAKAIYDLLAQITKK